MRSKMNEQLLRGLPNNKEWTRCKYLKWEVVLAAPDRVNIPCPMHDTRLCQIDVKMTNKLHGTKKDINTKPNVILKYTLWHYLFTPVFDFCSLPEIALSGASK